MKVLFVEPCWENFGGYFRAIGLAKALARKKIHVDLLIPTEKKFQLLPKKTKVNDYLNIYKLPKVQFHFWLSGRILRGLFTALWVLFKKYDIYHFFAIVHFETNIPFLFARLLGKKTVLDWDDHWMGMDIFYPNGKDDIRFKYFNFAEYTLQKFATHGSVTSEYLKNEFKSVGVDKTCKIINAMEDNQFDIIPRKEAREKLGIPQDEKILLTFGNTFFAERTIYLLKLCEILFKKDPDIKLYINMDPKKLIDQLPGEHKFDESIFDRIKNVGYLNKETMPLYTGACDAIVFTMGESTYEVGCFPIRVGSFMWSERAIFMNDTETEACQFLQGNEYAICGKDLDEMSDKITAFFNDKSQQEKIEKHINTTKNNHTWDKHTENLVEFYQGVL